MPDDQNSGVIGAEMPAVVEREERGEERKPPVFASEKEADKYARWMRIVLEKYFQDDRPK